ncbi:MAG: adenylyl-sulfate kinase [Blastopirellula sp.]|nr:MAG: adenylyl-sulfate kinase [Blastopirellula sp.]
MEKVDVVWHQQAVTLADRERLNDHQGCVVWFTGLSGCGKSTVANLVDRALFEKSVRSYLLDGDNVRHGLNQSPEMLTEQHGEEFARRFGVGFGPQDREENIRRIGALAQLFRDAGMITLAAFVSPYRKDRDLVRSLLETDGEKQDFIEVFVDTPLEICEQRDPKGLYKKARAGGIKGFTGIDAPYEAPLNPELVLQGELPAEQLASSVVEYLSKVGKIK